MEVKNRCHNYEMEFVKSYDRLKEDNGLMYVSANQRFREDTYPMAGSFKMFEYMEYEVGHGNFRNVKGKEFFIPGTLQGNLTKILYDNGASICGIDKSVVNIDIVKDKMPGGVFFQWDMLYGLPPQVEGKRFDYIVAVYSFNKYKEEEQVRILKSLKSILKEGGKIMLGDVGFITPKELEDCKRRHKEEWIDEKYIVISTLLPKLKAEGLNAEFIKVSYCAGVLCVW